MKCFGPEWNALMAVAVLGVIVYTIGIPFVLFVLLRRSRHYLYADECPRGELSRHAIVKKKLGAVYKDCESVILPFPLAINNVYSCFLMLFKENKDPTHTQVLLWLVLIPQTLPTRTISIWSICCGVSH